MMTHEEIEAAIERLRATEPSDYVGYVASVAKVVWGFMDGTVSALEFRDALIALLEQADPDTHMELPKDADGVPIHFGDELTNPHHAESFTVEAIGGNDVGSVPHVVYFRSSGGNLRFHYTTQCHHFHKPTVEEVLTELVDVAIGDIADKARNENMTYNDWAKSNEVIAEFAAKLREVMA